MTDYLKITGTWEIKQYYRGKLINTFTYKNMIPDEGIKLIYNEIMGSEKFMSNDTNDTNKNAVFYIVDNQDQPASTDTLTSVLDNSTNTYSKEIDNSSIYQATFELWIQMYLSKSEGNTVNPIYKILLASDTSTNDGKLYSELLLPEPLPKTDDYEYYFVHKLKLERA